MQNEMPLMKCLKIKVIFGFLIVAIAHIIYLRTYGENLGHKVVKIANHVINHGIFTINNDSRRHLFGVLFSGYDLNCAGSFTGQYLWCFESGY